MAILKAEIAMTKSHLDVVVAEKILQAAAKADKGTTIDL